MNFSVDNDYIKWVDRIAIPKFSKHNIQLTNNTKLFFAFALQSQIDEKAVRDNSTLFRLSKILLDTAIEIYTAKYAGEKINFNLALHLLVEASISNGKFPFNTSV